jgi:hypothetical protein
LLGIPVAYKDIVMTQGILFGKNIQTCLFTKI